MVTIKNTQFSSNLSLASVLNVMTKVKMLDICNKLELYVSPNLKKDETARRVAREILDNPCDVLHVLNKQGLQIVDDFVEADASHYAVRKTRKTYYKLQKFGLVVTYTDSEKDEWHMLMPDKLRESPALYYQATLTWRRQARNYPPRNNSECDGDESICKRRIKKSQLSTRKCLIDRRDSLWHFFSCLLYK